MAVANYHDVHGHFPPAYVLGPDGRPWHSWRVLILPYIEQQLYDAYKFDEPWDGPNNRQLADRMPSMYAFSTVHQPGNTTTNYLAVVGPETVWPGASHVTNHDVEDGASQTILVVENLGTQIHWMEPRDLSFAEMDFNLQSPKGLSAPYKGVAVAMVDGSIPSIARIQPQTLRAMLTINGGESVHNDDANGWEIIPDGRLRPLKE